MYTHEKNQTIHGQKVAKTKLQEEKKMWEGRTMKRHGRKETKTI